MKKLTQLAMLATVVGGIGFTTTTAQAKTKAPAILNYVKSVKPVTAKATKGYMYPGWQLTKPNHHLTNYKHTKFTVDQKISVTKANGKRAIYYWLTNKKGVHGYVWHGYVKVNGKIKIIKSKNNNTTPKTPQTGSQPAKQPDNSSSTTNNKSSLNTNEYINEFLTKLNTERAKRNLPSLTLDSSYQKISQERSSQLTSNYSHYDSNNNSIVAKLLKENNINPALWSECINQTLWLTDPNDGSDGGTSTKTVADASLHTYLYDDAAENWGHRDALLNPKFTKIGIGATMANKPDSTTGSYTVYDEILLGE